MQTETVFRIGGEGGGIKITRLKSGSARNIFISIIMSLILPMKVWILIRQTSMVVSKRLLRKSINAIHGIVFM
jgi:hypothetical protein